jgi:hypothetical protein
MAYQALADPTGLGWSERGVGKRPKDLAKPEGWVTMREAADLTGFPLHIVQADVRHKRVPTKRVEAPGKGVVPTYRILVRVKDILGLRRIGTWQKRMALDAVPKPTVRERFLECSTEGGDIFLVNLRYVRKLRRMQDGTTQVFETTGDVTTTRERYDEVRAVLVASQSDG